MGNKILFIGLDGVDFGLTEKLMQRGIMPNLERLCKKGTYGKMLSRPPLQSSCTWTSFITGKNAGKHGIFGYFSYRSDSYELKVLNSLDRRSDTLWHILNRCGKRVGILNLPCLFPPEKIDGYMVCGMLAPSISSNFTYPKELKAELLRSVKNYEIDIGMGMSSKDSKEMLLKKTYEITQKRTDAAKFLLEKFPCDLNIVIFTETDHHLHFFLREMDGTSKYKDEVANYFRYLDAKIGELLDKVPEDTTVIVMSDHGMAPFRKVLYVNNLLREMGLIGEGREAVGAAAAYSFTSMCFNFLVNLMLKLKLTPDTLKRFLPLWLFNRLNSILGKGKGFDWSRTRAFSTSIGDGIIINMKGRQPKGVVTQEEYEAIRNAIIKRIKEIKDPDSGETIVAGIYKREEVFLGEFVKNAPDIILKLKEGYCTDSSTKISGILKEENLLEPVTSDHTLNALLVISGGSIKQGGLPDKVNILDIAPTILNLMGVAVPPDLDGRVLSEVFSGKNEVPLMPNQQGEPGKPGKESDEDDKDKLTPEEEAQVKLTLKKLGYLRNDD